MWEGTEELFVRAPVERVWAVVTDVARHAELAGSGEVRAIRIDGPVAVGTAWEADEKVMGQRFVARSECVAFEPSSEFSWKSFPPPLRKADAESVPDVTWWFRLTPREGGTLVRHSFRVVEPAHRGAMLRAVYAVSRRPAKIRKGMRRTLRNLEAAVSRAG